ncbi:unnamed protein product [Adineta steineri]|uniref:Glomulin-like protein n=1 Tax=Adineta steineri TaxID=433720 RepID=A0A814E7S9_9BILA|nr:unnamed protein product [Adineta steineri]
MSTDDTDSTSFYPNTLIVKDISTFIDNSEFEKALNYLTSLTEQQIYDNTWDLCTYLFYLLEKPSEKLCNEYEIYSQDALTYVAQHGNSREMLIIMLEQCDKFISDNSFLFHIKLFSFIIKRLPLKPSLITSLRDIFSLLQCHLTTHELPTIDNDFAGNDLLIFNHDHRVIHLHKLTQSYIDFFCELRDYFSARTSVDIYPILTKSLISLLQGPLSSLSYEPINSQESLSFTSIRPLLDCLFTLNPNPISLIDNKEQHSVLIYLLLTKNDYFSRLPGVYSRVFYLFLSIPFIQQLSSDRERVMLTEKACVLVSNVCSHLTPYKEFDQTLLDNDQIHSLIDTLKMLMVQSPARQYSPLTIGAYRSLFRAFNPLGRCNFLRQQLAKTSYKEDSYRTFLCTLVKDEFLYDYQKLSSEIYKGNTLFQLLDHLTYLPNGAYRSLFRAFNPLGRCNFLRQQLAKTSYKEDSYRTFLCTLVKDEFLYDYQKLSSEIYKGNTLFQLLDHLTYLPNGVESDLLEIYDCLCSTLNLIRFIGLIDKRNINRTLFWTERLKISNEKFIKPLRKSIDLARAHYKLEIKNRLNGNNQQQQQQQADSEILVDDKPLSMPSQEEQLETLHKSVTKFDILDCILSSLSDTFNGEF